MAHFLLFDFMLNKLLLAIKKGFNVPAPSDSVNLTNLRKKERNVNTFIATLVSM